MNPTRIVASGSVPSDVYPLADAVRVGSLVFVSGQTGYIDGPAGTMGDMADQMSRAYDRVAAVLSEVGATVADIVDETVFVTDIGAAVAAAKTIRPAFYGGRCEVTSTLCMVPGFGHPEMTVEVKCIAVTSEHDEEGRER